MASKMAVKVKVKVKAKAKALSRKLRPVASHCSKIMEALRTNHLWRRMLKNVVATTTAISISLIHEPNTPFGTAAYLSAMLTIFIYPGRRFGQLVEALILGLTGGLLGAGWALLGIHLGSLVLNQSPPATFAIRGVFFSVALLFHGFLRSHTPRLYNLVLIQVILCIIGFTTTVTHVTSAYATTLIYPVLLGGAVVFLVNICIFPEFSSSFLGGTTIETLDDTAKALDNAGRYFLQLKRLDSRNLSSKQAHAGQRRGTAAVSPGESINLTHSSSENDDSIKTSPESHQDDTTKNTKAFPLSKLTKAKTDLRSKLTSCQAAQNECQFELAYSVLPPRYMKGISKVAMGKLFASATAVIGACESRYALLGEMSTSTDQQADVSNVKSSAPVANETGDSLEELFPSNDGTPNSRPSSKGYAQKDGVNSLDLRWLKPKREIEFGDAELLLSLLEKIKAPYALLEDIIQLTVNETIACLAFAYGVQKLPSGAKGPTTISLEQIDKQLDSMNNALIQFDKDTAVILEGGILQTPRNTLLDILPREEIFLISSFLLNIRQAATNLLEMLVEARSLVDEWLERKGRRRFYLPRIDWNKWLYSGDLEVESLPFRGRKGARQGALPEHLDDNASHRLSVNGEQSTFRKSKPGRETAPDSQDLHNRPNVSSGSKKFGASWEESRKLISQACSTGLRGTLADIAEWVQESEDFLYAVKLTVAAVLVTWPSFIPTWNEWYSLHRGTWAGLQLVLVSEVAIGASIMTFFIRGIGTTLGSLWGWAAYEARNGNPVVCAVMLSIGLIPATYVQLNSKYPKAGIVSMVNMSVVALSTELHTVPGTGTDNFLKRWIAFMIGGAIALVVEVILLPVRARARLVESLASSITHISHMEACVAFGIEEGVNVTVFPPKIFARFENASSKAKVALGAAEIFLPFCTTEPRVKGSFRALASIYSEIIFVLRQITDRMDNMLQLRTAYGSGPLEEFNAQLYLYRRNVAGSIIILLFAVQEALTMKTPLPHFLPSARLAQLRMINKVRDVVQASKDKDLQDISKIARHRLGRRKFVSWNAAAAAQTEIIEYMEELVDLTKLLVGANEFHSGLLKQPTYHEYAEEVETVEENNIEEDNENRDIVEDLPTTSGLTRRRTTSTGRSTDRSTDIPASLKRIQSRNKAASMERRNSG